MSKSASTDALAGSIYAMFWSMVHVSVHRYNSSPTGELLTVVAIRLLDEAGHRPAVSDLVEITGLPKSSVSRYVSRQIKAGFLKEIIDPQDRRRRYLCLTSEGKKESQWRRKQSLRIARLGREALRDVGKNKDPISNLKKVLFGTGHSPLQ
jgi:DNA-binding MarR family transcriptional regulator